ncbi:hypothetical protein ACFODL_02690 [Phenylobacterium terrae]|uniref:SWFGD domain-containing protein n=1 Tax=Phenylobacterium terrae TaxID=2665495 RepID=A0ABW4N459_9CAUL
MPGRDDFRSNREYEEYQRRRRELDRDPQRRMGGAERRSFEDRGRFSSDEARYGAENQPGRLGDYPGEMGQAEAWRAERAGSRYDQDRARYGWRGEDRWRQDTRPMREEREPWRNRRPDEVGYGGQEYGIEAHHDDRDRGSSIVQRSSEGGSGRRLEERFGQDDRGDPPFRGEPRGGAGHVTWRDDGAPYGDSHLDRQDRGMREFGVPHDYGFHPHDEEFEPHYTHWRDEQMRRHDEEYRNWRTQQLRQYDEDYRAWRGERRQAFGETFSQWRSQRSNLTRGTPDTGVAPGVTGGASFGAKQTSFGGSQATAPSGAHEAEPAGRSEGGSEGQAGQSGGDVGFAQASPAVQKATDGEARGDTRDNDNDRERKDGKDRS